MSPWTVFLIGGAGVGIVVGAVYLASRGGRLSSGGSEFLCDRCAYNHPNTCSQPERPNATRCAEFRAK